MRRRRTIPTLVSAWAIAAHLAVTLLVAPCACDAMAAAETKVCCCGPGAENPCHGTDTSAPESCAASQGDCAMALDQAPSLTAPAPQDTVPQFELAALPDFAAAPTAPVLRLGADPPLDSATAGLRLAASTVLLI